jgi:DNA (cytosine-5)-methyltransferase 1
MLKANRNGASASPRLRLNSFFAGVGGFDLAFEECGFLPVFQCENNQF